MKKFAVNLLIFTICMMLMACESISVTKTTSKSYTTSKTTTLSSTSKKDSTTITNQVTTNSVTTKSEGSKTFVTSTTKKSVVSTPIENDLRSAGTYTKANVLIDDKNKEFKYKNAYVYETTDENIDGGSFITSVHGKEFTATISPTIETSGNYRVYLSFANIDDATNYVSLEVTYNGGENNDYNRYLDQTINQGVWVYVGTYFFKQGNQNNVTIRDAAEGIVSLDSAFFQLTGASDTITSEDNIKTGRYFDATSVTNIVMDKKTRSSYLRVNGEDYFVNGICGVDELELMAEAGCNTARTYSADLVTTKAILDKAQELGMKIMVGLWMNHETANFTYYNNPNEVKEQFDNIKKVVTAFKDHPAVLCWAIGNEVDISTSVHKENIYYAMNDLARMVKELDPYRPTMAVLAGSSTDKIKNIMKYCNHIDMIGYNSYIHIGNVQTNTSIFPGPYMVTEFALNQPSETKTKTSWDVILEPNNKEKGELYKSRYIDYIYNYKDKNCVGSFAFKDTGSFRVTHTWYGLIYNDRKTLQYYYMSSAWNNEENPINPYISNIYVNNKVASDSVVLDAQALTNLRIELKNLNGASVNYVVEIRKEVATSVNNVPAVLDIAFKSTSAGIYSFTTPTKGNYRIYVYAYIGDDYVTFANIPISVQ